MTQDDIQHLLSKQLTTDGTFDTGIPSVKLFRVSTPLQCAHAVYEPMVIAIVSGTKEAIFDSERHLYDRNHYMCCTMSMPVEVSTPNVSPEDPLLGVVITLDTRLMTELVIEAESHADVIRNPRGNPTPPGFTLASWEPSFSDALGRLLKLSQNPADAAILGEGRLRELYYAILKGDAASSVRRSFGVGNEIAKAVQFLSNNLSQPVSVDQMSAQLGMSRAVFHRKFKQATHMSPIQFVKSMRLNKAATYIAEGTSVNQAAREVGYESPSQFNREFKRMYGLPPRQWSTAFPTAQQPL